MKTTTTTKSLAGKGDVTLTVGLPTYDQILAHYEGNQELFIDNWCGHKIANDLATRVKSVFTKIHENQSLAEDKQKKLSDAEMTIYAMVMAGEELVLLDFVGKPRSAKADEYQLLIRQKWALSEKKAAFLTRLGLAAELLTATASEVESAYLQKRDELSELL